MSLSTEGKRAPVFRRSAARLLTKNFCKITGVGEAALSPYLGDALSAGGKECGGLLNPVLSEITDRRDADDTAEAAQAFALADSSAGGYLSRADFLRKMLLYILKHKLCAGGIPKGLLGGQKSTRRAVLGEEKQKPGKSGADLKFVSGRFQGIALPGSFDTFQSFFFPGIRTVQKYILQSFVPNQGMDVVLPEDAVHAASGKAGMENQRVKPASAGTGFLNGMQNSGVDKKSLSLPESQFCSTDGGKDLSF